jgi:hypothetical protein
VRTWLALVALSAASVAFAESPVRDDGYLVHYAALSSRDLPAATVQALGIEPDAQRALVLVNVQREGAVGHPITASASGVAHRLAGTDEPLQFRVTRDGDLIAPLDIVDRQHVTFELEVTPAGSTRAIAVKFTQQFYTD